MMPAESPVRGPRRRPAARTGRTESAQTRPVRREALTAAGLRRADASGEWVSPAGTPASETVSLRSLTPPESRWQDEVAASAWEPAAARGSEKLMPVPASALNSARGLAVDRQATWVSRPAGARTLPRSERPPRQ